MSGVWVAGRRETSGGMAATAASRSTGSGSTYVRTAPSLNGPAPNNLDPV